MVISFSCAASPRKLINEQPNPTVHLIKTEDNAIVVFVEASERNQKCLFILQTREDYGIERNQSIENCSIVYSKTHVTFKAPDSTQIWVFKLSNVKEEFKEGTIMKGYGLILNFNEQLTDSIAKAVKDNKPVGPPVLEFSCKCAVNGTSSSCDSGGTGSNGCSTTSSFSVASSGATTGCSVSCGGGYYSCCVD